MTKTTSFGLQLQRAKSPSPSQQTGVAANSGMAAVVETLSPEPQPKAEKPEMV